MYFPSITTTLTIEDNLALESLDLVIMYPDKNLPLQDIVDDYFFTDNAPKKKMYNADNNLKATTTIKLNNASKEKIEALIVKLHELNDKYENRLSVVNSFKDLVK